MGKENGTRTESRDVLSATSFVCRPSARIHDDSSHGSFAVTFGVNFTIFSQNHVYHATFMWGHRIERYRLEGSFGLLTHLEGDLAQVLLFSQSVVFGIYYDLDLLAREIFLIDYFAH